MAAFSCLLRCCAGWSVWWKRVKNAVLAQADNFKAMKDLPEEAQEKFLLRATDGLLEGKDNLLFGES